MAKTRQKVVSHEADDVVRVDVEFIHKAEKH